VYFQVRGLNTHEIVIFDVIFHILEVSGGRWATMSFFICAVLVKLTFLNH